MKKEKKKVKLMLGDNMISLKKMPDNSVDSVVTDPPYGISFMNKKWDHDVPSVELWEEVMRVLKPGGHMLVACGTKTQHRMVVNIEDAGFEVRDVITWMYGSGFPKSHNIGKAIDKIEANEREVIGENENHRKTSGLLELGFQDGKESSLTTKGNSKYEGWGTALKPAQEFFTLVRKPLSEKTIAANVLKWGTGGINIDGCRVGNEETTQGRFPANVILDEEAGKLLDEQFNASRFFYCPKVSKKERNLGCEDFEEKERIRQGLAGEKNNTLSSNIHPTVKPISLMSYLCRLITPTGGIVLDPYMGSGSTGVAALLEGFRFCGMEMDEEYMKISEARINAHEEYRKIIK